MVDVEETGASSAAGGGAQRPRRAAVKPTDFRALGDGKPQPAQILGKRPADALDGTSEPPASRRQRRQPQPPPRRRGGASAANAGSAAQPRLNTSVETNFARPRPPVFGGGESSRAGEGAGAGASADAGAAIRESLSRMEAQLNRIDGSTRDLSTRQAEQSVRLDELTGQTAAMNDRVTAQTATMNDRVAAMEAQLGVGQHAPGLVNNPAPGAAAIQPAAEMVEVSFFDTNRPVTSAVRDILKIRASERTEDQQKTADRAFKECFVKPIGGGQYVVPMGTDLTGMGDIVDGETTRMTKVQEPHAAEERIYYWVPPTAGDRAAAAAVPELRPEGRAGSRWDNDAMKSIAQLYVAEAGVDVGPCAHWLQVDVETGKVMTPAAGKSTRELTMIKIPQVRQPAANQNRRDGIGL